MIHADPPPRLFAILCLLAAVCILVLAFWFAPSGQRTVTEAPTPTPTLRVSTTTPASTLVTLEAGPPTTKMPRPTITPLPDRLPIRSPEPSATSTQTPIAEPSPTATPTRVPQTPVQRG